MRKRKLTGVSSVFTTSVGYEPNTDIENVVSAVNPPVSRVLFYFLALISLRASAPRQSPRGTISANGTRLAAVAHSKSEGSHHHIRHTAVSRGKGAATHHDRRGHGV